MDISSMKPWKKPWKIVLACIGILIFFYIASMDIELINAVVVLGIAGYIIYSVNKRDKHIKQLEDKVNDLEQKLKS